MADSIVIASAARTPIGGLLGDFSSLAAHQLGAIAIKAAVARAGITGDTVDEALMGNCLMAGQGQAPARQAMRKAGLPDATGAVTLSKMCGSGMRAMMFAHDMLAAGSANVVVAGGMESMTNAPHLTMMRKGVKYGVAQLYDHMALDGLEDAYEKLPNGGGKAMGVFAEECVAKYGFTREQQDQFSVESHKKAANAMDQGFFKSQIIPIEIKTKKGIEQFTTDEHVRKEISPADMAKLKTVFKKDGTVTAGNASGINDAGAAIVLASSSFAEKNNLRPMARLVAYAHAGVDPQVMGLGPIPAVKRVFEKSGLKPGDMDVVESNEAFAVQAMAVTKDLGLDPAKVNVVNRAVGGLSSRTYLTQGRLQLAGAEQLRNASNQNMGFPMPQAGAARISHW